MEWSTRSTRLFCEMRCFVLAFYVLAFSSTCVFIWPKVCIILAFSVLAFSILADSYLRFPYMRFPSLRNALFRTCLLRTCVFQYLRFQRRSAPLTPPAGWLPRTGISSGTLRSVIEYRLPLPFYYYSHYQATNAIVGHIFILEILVFSLQQRSVRPFDDPLCVYTLK